ncbi:hypothetical protein LOOC260_101590 [Paucilactobacillus hokkaidonensis JCM 18461]|uniref:Uncharacterized protein n=3 Tax=Paucilactobacillus hokkaidonensis TaxID=1193095 RepID=A0A0A1GR21_9LACO|nr:hypothetical protein LOOC260_101590 [Paucilactobacillus hokkaidonensis JCM 18461]
MNRNDIGYIFVQYINDPNNGKKRPILIIRDSDEMLKFYKITSKYVNKSVNIKKNYFEINDWHYAGLRKKSWIDINHPYSIDKPSEFYNGLKHFDHLSENDIFRFETFIKTH